METLVHWANEDFVPLDLSSEDEFDVYKPIFESEEEDSLESDVGKHPEDLIDY